MATPATARRPFAKTAALGTVVFLLFSAAATTAAGQGRRMIVVDRDNVDVRESCTLVFSEKPIVDADEIGRAHV